MKEKKQPCPLMATFGEVLTFNSNRKTENSEKRSISLPNLGSENSRWQSSRRAGHCVGKAGQLIRSSG